MPRLSSKEKYIKAVFNLYKEKGLQLSMEQIAEELHVTKKTLYNNFENKDDMLKTVVGYFFHGLYAKVMTSVEQSKNAIEELFLISATIRSEIDSLGDVLLSDVVKENVDLFVHSNRTSFYSKVIRENLQRGIDENLYRNDIDVDNTTLFYTSVVDMFYKKDNTNRLFKRSSTFYPELIKYHLYSIVRTESRELLESYFNK